MECWFCGEHVITFDCERWLVTTHDIFFFKQKTAYEMRINDWSADVCSSDLMKWLFASHNSSRTAPRCGPSPVQVGLCEKSIMSPRVPVGARISVAGAPRSPSQRYGSVRSAFWYIEASSAGGQASS